MAARAQVVDVDMTVVGNKKISPASKALDPKCPPTFFSIQHDVYPDVPLAHLLSFAAATTADSFHFCGQSTIWVITDSHSSPPCDTLTSCAYTSTFERWLADDVRRRPLASPAWRDMLV